jgi:hypothetical protein
MVGNENDAALALSGNLPMIGEGCTRRVYLSDGVVYKVEYFDTVHHTSNADEYALASTLVVPAGMAIPNVTLYPNGVLAMEYVDGEYRGECYCLPNEEHYGCHDDETTARLSEIGLDVPTWGNTVYRDGMLWLIDLA